MPKVVKQSMKKAPTKKGVKKNNGDIWSQIQAVDELEDDGIKLSIYGRSKTGKTRLACTFPKPLLLIGTEKGTKSVKGTKGVHYVRIKHSEELDRIVEGLKEGEYESFVVDTAGGLSDMCLKEVLGIDDLPIQRSWGMAKREDWQTSGAQTKERLRQLLDLSETHGVNAVIIAHERNFNDEGTDNSIIFPTVGSALTPSVTGWLNGAVDYIGQTFIREVTEQRTVKLGAKSVSREVKTGNNEYCLRIGSHSVFMTGFRIPKDIEAKLPGGKLPEWISNPSYDKIVSILNGELT